MPTASARVWTACRAARSRFRPPAASAVTVKRSGAASTASMAWVPIEPVEPSRTTLRGEDAGKGKAAGGAGSRNSICSSIPHPAPAPVPASRPADGPTDGLLPLFILQALENPCPGLHAVAEQLWSTTGFGGLPAGPAQGPLGVPQQRRIDHPAAEAENTRCPPGRLEQIRGVGRFLFGRA